MNDLIAKLEAATEGECWIWPRKVDKQGRGRIWVNGRIMLAHRAVWEHLRGPIPPGLLLCHNCDNPSCVNPAHIYLGTHADNMHDMKERRRYHAARNPESCRAAGIKGGLMNTWTAGEKNPKAKLSPEDVEKIRASEEGTKSLVAQFSVDRTTIQRIRRGALWATR